MELVTPRLFVLGYSEAAMLLRNPGDVRVTAIISIHGQRESPISTAGVPHSLVLRFDDTEAHDANDLLEMARIRLRQREAAEIGLSLNPPSEADAQAIIEFARGIRTMKGALLCQCSAGISRSPAAALLCLAEWLGPGRESECVEYLLGIRPSALPHRDLVRFGDKLMHRDGQLLAALEVLRP